MKEFQECVAKIDVVDVNATGIHYTWNQKPKNGAGIFKKIDRIMGNVPFMHLFPASCAIFQPYRISDHCPCVLKLPNLARNKPRSFKLANFLVHKPEFNNIVRDTWDMHIEGVPQFQVVKKLKLLKSSLQSLLYKQG